MIYQLGEDKINSILQKIAEEVAIAALTAPKGRGINKLEILLVNDEDLLIIADEMDKIALETQQTFFTRDANNLRKSSSLILIGTDCETRKLNYCGLCGFTNCLEKEKFSNVPCVFNILDLGIAIGSVVSKLSDLRIDNRIMYTIGIAAIRKNLFSKNIKIALGIPIAANSKNIFFDRTH